MKCPKCGTFYVADYAIVDVEWRTIGFAVKHESYAKLHPDEPRFRCVCGFKWGKFTDSDVNG